jgi:hypothetical protein
MPRVTLRARHCSGVFLSIAACALALAAPARAEVIEQESTATPVAAYGSYAAWSRAEGKQFRLVIWHDGSIRRAAVAPRNAQFDVDLGRDAAGRTVAVYSRCPRITRPGTGFTPLPFGYAGCDLYEYDIAGRRERRLAGPSTKAGSEYLPAISGHRLVFTRATKASYRHPGAPFPSLVSATLGRHYREQPLPRPASYPSHSYAKDTNFGPTGIDVDGRHAAIAWAYQSADDGCRETDETGHSGPVRVMVLYDLATRVRRILDSDCHTFARGLDFREPSLDGGDIFYKAGVDKPLPDDSVLRAVAIGTGAQHDTTFPPADVRANVDSTQTSGGWTWASLSAGYPITFSIQRFPAPVE